MQAQDNERPEYVIVTTIHRNLDKTDGSKEEWLALEKEYLEKVIKKNEFIMGASMANHHYTADNTEMLRVGVYKNWGDIERAQKRNGELAKEAWPDEIERDDFFKKMDSYYTTMHSDEIYATMPGAKIAQSSDEPRLWYMRTSHFAFPDDGSTEEYLATSKEIQEKLIQNNNYVKGYYPMRHAWGADKRDFLEVFMFDSMADLEASSDTRDELVDKHWPDKEARKEFFTKSFKYYTGFHADYIYESIPELSK
jgi:hypothetical protein